jgi:hypothetical protein
VSSLQTEVTTLNTDVDALKYNTTNITYTPNTTNILSDQVSLSTPAGYTEVNGKLYASNILPNSLLNVVNIGPSDQSGTIILNGTLVMPLNDLYSSVFTSTSNGFFSQI